MSQIKVPVAYVTKWALTRGILEIHNAEEDHDGYLVKKSEFTRYHLGPKDWHRTLEDAQHRVKKMKAARKKSLEKALSKLETFQPTITVLD